MAAWSPTCVMRAEQLTPKRTVERLTFPSRLIGAGYPILTDVQGQMHAGTEDNWRSLVPFGCRPVRLW